MLSTINLMFFGYGCSVGLVSFPTSDQSCCCQLWNNYCRGMFLPISNQLCVSASQKEKAEFSADVTEICGMAQAKYFESKTKRSKTKSSAENVKTNSRLWSLHEDETQKHRLNRELLWLLKDNDELKADFIKCMFVVYGCTKGGRSAAMLLSSISIPDEGNKLKNMALQR